MRTKTSIMALTIVAILTTSVLALALPNQALAVSGKPAYAATLGGKPATLGGHEAQLGNILGDRHHAGLGCDPWDPRGC